MRLPPPFFLILALASLAPAAEFSPPPVRFNTAFEGGSLGRIDRVSDTEFRLNVQGQQDNRGRNRQATWYYFRMDNVRGRELVLTLTGFLPGEYNDKPAPHMNGDPQPVFSYDGERWTHYAGMEWDNIKREGLIRLRPERDSIWFALVPPYTHSRLLRLLERIGQSPHARVESIGRSVLGRDLALVTVTDFARSDAGKKTVWLRARDHAWESPTSYIMEGALSFIVSDDPQARALRESTIFVFSPMVDPDGCALGQVRFNANGYEAANRHWNDIDLRDPEWLRKLPEVWYQKKAVRDYLSRGRRIDLMVYLHNTIAEFMAANAPTADDVPRLERFHEILVAKTQFDPSRPLQTQPGFGLRAGEPAPWWAIMDVPLVLVEMRIAPGRKLGGSPTVEHRISFGPELLLAMAEAVR